MDIASAVLSLRTGLQFSVDGNTYEGIIWPVGYTNIPTKQEVEAEAGRLAKERSKNNKKSEIDKNRDELKYSPISYKIGDNFFSFQTDLNSRIALINAASIMDDVETVDWITYENDIVSLTKSDIINICNMIQCRDSDLYIQARKMKDEILSSTS